ncbi:uncharacterized protein EV154DRAFT_499355 [Mucor mucedo]|uniref:uncharacterized protein n=1 Tax=Mucor mucedo TaxID=29922 RepID=UPI002220079A|nr:uncharacterized protein EV154DRAFT_499355 [Mucor mucedo]KAI7894096.1 hypothetical protein EV154DRAFT_499355 [Mucor mucedo]
MLKEFVKRVIHPRFSLSFPSSFPPIFLFFFLFIYIHMVCATIMNKRHLEEEEDEFDMVMEEDDDSEDDSSQDESPPKRPITQPLFLNFTSDLSPQKANKKKSKPKKQTAYRVNGVNILNRNNLDSKTAIERIQRRRENHNHVERRRRDNINNTIFELSNVVPNAIQPGQKPNKGSILKLSLDYIRDLQAENNALKERLNLSHNVAINTNNSMRVLPVATPLPASSPSPPAPAPAALQALQAPALQAPINVVNEIYPPSAPNSPRFIVSDNSIFTQTSISLPSSPQKEELRLPQQHHQAQYTHPHQQYHPAQQQQQLQNGFSNMSVSSNSSSAASTPTHQQTFYTPIYIPQPPQLYNQMFNTQQPQQHKQPQPQQQQSGGLRPLLPAASFLPALRMGGYEKIYGNVCRY